MVNIKKRFIAGLATLAMTVTLATGVAQNTILGDITNSSSIMVAEAATTVTAKNTYNTTTGNNNGTRTRECNISTSKPNIILVGDSRTCQLLNYDYQSGAKRFSGIGAWGMTYNASIANSISNESNKNITASNGVSYSAYSYVTTQIHSALKKNTPCHIWVFGTINETSGDASAKNLTAYVNKLISYINSLKDTDIGANKKVTIHVVHTIGGTSDWAAANKNVSAYNTNMDKLNGKKLGRVSVVTTGYANIVKGNVLHTVNGKSYGTKYCVAGKVYGYAYKTAAKAKESAYTNNTTGTNQYSKSGIYGTKTTTINGNNTGLDNGLHYTVDTLDAMSNWIYASSK